jgi:hypothetical protein
VLAIQTLASASENYAATERWSWVATITGTRSKTRVQPAVVDERTRVDAELDLVWHWRPQWDVVLRGVRTNFRYQAPDVDQAADSNGVYLLLTRVFGPRRVW